MRTDLISVNKEHPGSHAPALLLVHARIIALFLALKTNLTNQPVYSFCSTIAQWIIPAYSIYWYTGLQYTHGKKMEMIHDKYKAF